MDLIETLKENTFILGIYRKNQLDNIQLIGTVFAIAKKSFIGSLHCIEKWSASQYIAINPNTKDNYFLEIKSTDKNKDLVVFNLINQNRDNWINLSNCLPKEKDNVYIYGYPKENCSLSDYKGTLISAKIKAFGGLTEEPQLGNVIIFDQLLLGNHSGSPILDEQGLLIGVAKSVIIAVPKFKGCSLGISLIDK